MEEDLSDLYDSCFLLSLDLLETLYLFSDTRASESLVFFCEREDVSDLVSCKDLLIPVMLGPGNDEVQGSSCNSELHSLLYLSFRLFLQAKGLAEP